MLGGKPLTLSHLISSHLLRLDSSHQITLYLFSSKTITFDQKNLLDFPNLPDRGFQSILEAGPHLG